MLADSLPADPTMLDAGQVVRIAIRLIGGLALFLYGIEKMSDGLRAVAGDRLKTLLARLTANRFLGVLTGAVMTAVVQSSSLTTVLVVGFVSAGLMTLQQSVGVILGANIGATLTVQVAAFRVTDSAWVLIAAGFAAFALGRRDAARQLGSVLLGLGLLFLALSQMAAATSPLRDYPPFLVLMANLQQPVLGILAGMLVTSIIQSSSATSGVVLALASQGLMTLPAALAVTLGANLGSCVTAQLAAIGKPAEARQAATVHLLFNCIGVLVWSFFIPQLAAIVTSFSSDLPRQIANAHTIFNVANTLVLIWFSGSLARAAQWLVPAPAARAPTPAFGAPRYLDDALLETPALALHRVRLELGHMGGLVMDMFDQAGPAVMSGTRIALNNTAALDRAVNQVYVATVDYTRRLARREMSLPESRALEDCIAAANHLETAGDIIALNYVTQGRRRLELGLKISPPTQELLMELHAFVADALRTAIAAFQEGDVARAERVVQGKDDFARRAQTALEQLRHRLMDEGPDRTRTFQMEVDLVAQLQRLHHLARRLAKLVLPAGIDDHR